MQSWADESTKSNIKPKISKIGNSWQLTLIEDFQSIDDAGNFYHSNRFEKRVAWSDHELKKWKNCVRNDQNSWIFENKNDAEKFITVFHLSWVQ